jgi:hypothetical protein
MSGTMWRDEMERFSALVEKFIVLDQDGTDLRQKIDILERLIEIWRFVNRSPDNLMPLEEVFQSSALFGDDAVTLIMPERSENLGKGIPPIQLQAPLLIYLLRSREKYKHVYDIIRDFIESYRDKLSVLDFKKTETGVTRCFTNTRFAANTLRVYGLLKYTNREAYKTWILSLPGMVVAARMIRQDQNIASDQHDKSYKLDLHKNIVGMWPAISSYDLFVSTLSSVCRPNVDIFHSFEKMLRKAHEQLVVYWRIIGDKNLKVIERRKLSLSLIHELEENPDIETFCREFSDSINVDLFLQSILE